MKWACGALWRAQGGAGFLAPASSSRFKEAARSDPIIARLEARIANATGIAPHAHEDLVSFARIRTRGNDIKQGYYAPFGLHHETDGRPYRAKTILLYLQAPKEGGRTIFPLCSPPPGDPDPFTRFRPYLAHFFPVFSHFLRVFTVSTRRF